VVVWPVDVDDPGAVHLGGVEAGRGHEGDDACQTVAARPVSSGTRSAGAMACHDSGELWPQTQVVRRVRSSAHHKGHRVPVARGAGGVEAWWVPQFDDPGSQVRPLPV
jgi:hypothetical protein